MAAESSDNQDWARGDRLGLPIPAHAEALRSGGVGYLTLAFRASGVLGPQSRVAEITGLEGWDVGGTGAKLVLSVRYDQVPDLPTELFVKFSRNFDDPIRDRTRFHMEPEVRLAALSQMPGFPVVTPKCLLADFNHESGTGVLITERVGFGQNGVEPHRPKCLDHQLPDPLGHYRALITAIARLAGAHKAGRLPTAVADQFPFVAEAAVAANPLPPAARLDAKLARLAQFAADYPQLFPETLRRPEALARFAKEARLFKAHEAAIAGFLHARPDFIALCHWNANVDNAWFWREADGMLACGLMDWGSVGQMSLAMTLWGCLSGAEPEIWADHLEDLLHLFAKAFEEAGGPPLDLTALRLHLQLYVAMMGLAWLLDAPARITRELPDLSTIENRFDPAFTASETARTQLLMLTNVINLWLRSDVGETVQRLFG